MESEKQAFDELINLIKKLDKHLSMVAAIVLSTDTPPQLRDQIKPYIVPARQIVMYDIRDKLRIIIKDEELIEKLRGAWE